MKTEQAPCQHAGRINLLSTILLHQIYMTFIMLYTIIILF